MAQQAPCVVYETQEQKTYIDHPKGKAKKTFFALVLTHLFSAYIIYPWCLDLVYTVSLLTLYLFLCYG